MASTDVFALGRLGLNAFLYEEICIEANGAALTMVSVLARLGKDPWIEAARWAGLPRPAAIDCVSQSLALMALDEPAAFNARTTAARLAQLLPRPAPAARPALWAAGWRRWWPWAVLGCLLAGGVAAAVIWAPERMASSPALTQPGVR